MDVCEEVMFNSFKTSECKMMNERNSIIACVTSPWVESVSDEICRLNQRMWLHFGRGEDDLSGCGERRGL